MIFSADGKTDNSKLLIFFAGDKSDKSNLAMFSADNTSDKSNLAEFSSDSRSDKSNLMIFSSDKSNHAIFSAGLPHHCLQQPGWQDPWRSTRPARFNDDIMDNDDNEDVEHD